MEGNSSPLGAEVKKDDREVVVYRQRMKKTKMKNMSPRQAIKKYLDIVYITSSENFQKYFDIKRGE